MGNAGVYKKINVFDGDGSVAASAENVSIKENRIILLGDDFRLMPHNTVVSVIAYNDDGILPIEAKITLSTSSQMNLDIVDLAHKTERRTYLKVRTNRKADLLRMYSLGKRGIALNIDEEVTLRDISVGGMCFYSNRVFFKNQRILIRLNDVKQDFICEALILRRQKGKFTEKYRNKYGCRFLGLNNEQQRALCEFVFKIQIENHKKMLEKMQLEEESVL